VFPRIAKNFRRNSRSPREIPRRAVVHPEQKAKSPRLPHPGKSYAKIFDFEREVRYLCEQFKLFYKDKHVQKSINALFNLENEKNFDILLGLGFFIRQKRIEGAVHTIHDDFAQAWPNFRSSWTHQFLKAKINQN
jgi:hypothetical protein